MLFYREAWWAIQVLEESDTNAEEFSFTLPPRRCLRFLFILRIRAPVNEATAHAEMPPLWDAGVNGKQTCWKKDAMHSNKAKTEQQSYWIWRYLIPRIFLTMTWKCRYMLKKENTDSKNQNKKERKIPGKI